MERFELPNLGALNFLLHESLGGGGTLSLMTDAQGKTFSTALLRMEIDVSEEEARSLRLTYQCKPCANSTQSSIRHDYAQVGKLRLHYAECGDAKRSTRNSAARFPGVLVFVAASTAGAGSAVSRRGAGHARIQSQR